MIECLVQYIGKRRGKFRQSIGRYPSRQWAGRGRTERWLPEVEATLWDQQRDWRITRTREVEQPPAPDIQLAQPAPPARHVGTLVEEAAAEVQRVAQRRDAEESEFCLSDNGVVHKVGCPSWPKYPLKTFVTFGNAVNDEDFGRVHQTCCRAELGRKEMRKRLEDIDGAVAQMNVMGESYGIDQKET